MSRLLLIDDDAAFREGLAETLRDLGHEALEALDGEAGLALAQASRPALVFLDLRMPGLDGMEVLRRLRADAAAPPVVVLTAYASGANTIEAMRQGAFDRPPTPCSGSGTLAAAAGPVRTVPAPASKAPCGMAWMAGTSPAKTDAE